MALDGAWAVAWMTLAAERIGERASELGELDRAIGDGDHGENMRRGFAEVDQSLAGMQEGATPSEVLRVAAMTLISAVGGAAGPLYGTALLRASQVVAGRDILGSDDVVALLEAARKGIEDRGHAVPGDKTMIDGWSTAATAARSAAESGSGPEAVLSAAADGAASGAAATDALLPRKGRASYLGERAVGHRDPGAESTAIILQAAAEAAA